MGGIEGEGQIYQWGGHFFCKPHLTHERRGKNVGNCCSGATKVSPRPAHDCDTPLLSKVRLWLTPTSHIPTPPSEGQREGGEHGRTPLHNLCPSFQVSHPNPVPPSLLGVEGWVSWSLGSPPPQVNLRFVKYL